MTPSDRDATGLLTRPEPMVQLVTPTGERRANAEFDPWIADIDLAAIGRLYRDMAIVRRIDTEAIALQRQGELGLWPPLPARRPRRSDRRARCATTTSSSRATASTGWRGAGASSRPRC